MTRLDDAFANMAYIPNAESFPPRWAQQAQDFRGALGPRAEVDNPYGSSPRQAYDFFRCEGPSRGTLIFVHGGYWLRFDRKSWSHLASGALALGWDVATLGYDLCPQVRIAEITDQIAQAVRHLAIRTQGPISLAGHSAGGHLVARMLGPDVLGADVLSRVMRVAPISPVADLRPLLQTSMNDAFQMEMADAEAESPVLQTPPTTPVKIWVGADERPVFLEQASALAAVWDVPLVVVPKVHHFDVIDALCDTESDMVTFLTENPA